jgi:hypothetical protein
MMSRFVNLMNKQILMRSGLVAIADVVALIAAEDHAAATVVEANGRPSPLTRGPSASRS